MRKLRERERALNFTTVSHIFTGVRARLRSFLCICSFIYLYSPNKVKKTTSNCFTIPTVAQYLFSVSSVLLLQQTIIPNKQPCLKASNRINNEINDGKGQWQDQRISHVALKSIWGRQHDLEQFTEMHGENAKRTYWLGQEFQAWCATFSFTILQNRDFDFSTRPVLFGTVSGCV